MITPIEAKYRLYYKGIAPKPIKAEIPGWIGDSNKYGDRSKPQPWHCMPFVEASIYGLELIYPFEAECRVTYDGAKISFMGDFTGESPWTAEGQMPDGSPPFMSFAHGHYGFTSSMDIEPPEGYIVRTEPHPRYYTDETGTVPLCIAGHIQNWWPKIFFVVFKAPWPGKTHIFRKGEPYGQILILPRKMNVVMKKMTQGEESRRTKMDSAIVRLSKELSTHSFKSDSGHRFDNKYKQLSKVYAKKGYEGIEELIAKASSKSAARHGKQIGRLITRKK